MKKLSNNCSRTEVWASPDNWETTTAKSALKKNWYVQCDFYDPLHSKKYPKGFPYRKKLNKFKTLEERRAAVKLLMVEIPKLLDQKGYNPITGKFMIEEAPEQIIALNPQMHFIKALTINYPLLSVSEGVKKEIKRIVKKIDQSAIDLNLNIAICQLHSGHIRDLLDRLNLTPNEYNKYLTHLSIVLSDLVEKRMLFHNPIRDIKKKKTIKKMRETLEISHLQQIFKVLKSEHYTFYRYGMIFFHSGARTSELFRVQKKHVNLEKQEYKVTIMKGDSYKEVKKVILPNALPFWEEIISECSNENDFLFTRNLQPSLTPIQPYQITKRWKRLVKDKLSVTADFYSLKHLFLDELDKVSVLAGPMASHTTNVTEKNYLFGREGRKNEALKKVRINVIT
jgi:site-specific recombinase XerC